MFLRIKKIKEGLLVEAGGELDMNVADKLRTDICHALEKSGALHLFFDFKEVSFIDSSGLGVILGRYRELAERGGHITISGVNQQVYQVLKLSGLTKIIDVERPEARRKVR